jgi:enoyl-CoA hydratase/carnithine racemase
MTVASPTATFGLPEALRGIYAGGGGPPRLVHNAGMPLAAEITMTGRKLSASEALQYNLVNRISTSPETVVEEALALASKVANVSPDAITVTRASLREAWETASVQRGNDLVDARYLRALLETENAKEGLTAFKEKREPVWKAGKL